MISKIKVGERYEVKPKDFHRAIIGKVVKVDGEKIFFDVETCDMVDRERATAGNLVEAGIFDVKSQLSQQFFFS